jgi:tetratricopeptide (TPR) repeat protein
MLSTPAQNNVVSSEEDSKDATQDAALFIDKLLGVLNSDILSVEAAEKLYGFGYALYEQGQLAEATETFLYLILYSKTQAKNYGALAACCQVQQDFEKAALLYQFSIELGNTVPVTHFQLGECFLRLNRKSEALEQFTLTAKLTCKLENQYSLFEKSVGLIDLIKNSANKNCADSD